MQLTLKVVMLMALLLAQRVQTLQSLCVEGMSPLPGEYVFYTSSILNERTGKGCQSRRLL